MLEKVIGWPTHYFHMIQSDVDPANVSKDRKNNDVGDNLFEEFSFFKLFHIYYAFNGGV
jgi:hypothetical protein